jgi:hypothetical protein
VEFLANTNRAARGDSIGVLENSSAADIHGLNTSRITELFEGFGYLCKPEAKVRGISGNLHNFDFVCAKRDTGEKLVMESLLSVNGTQGEMEVEFVKLRLKTYDCSPDICFVVVKSSSEQLREMGSLYRLTIIDSSSKESPYDQIESLLRLRDGDLTQRSIVPQ